MKGKYKRAKRDPRVSDAIAFLRYGMKLAYDGVRKGKRKQFTPAELHMALALDALEGK